MILWCVIYVIENVIRLEVKSLSFLHPLFTPVVLVDFIVLLDLAHLSVNFSVISIQLSHTFTVS